MSSRTEVQPPPTPDDLAEGMKAVIGELVRTVRAVDRLAPIPATVLELLDRRGPLTTAELAAGRGVRHQTMAATVKELVEARYVTAGADPGDARKKVLTLTAEGKRAVDADRRERIGAMARAVAETLDEEERRVLARALTLIERITAAVGEAESSAPGGRRRGMRK